MALTLSGTGQYLSQSTAIVTAAPFTVACWFKNASTAVNQVLMQLATASAQFVLDVNAGTVRAFSGAGVSTTGSYSANAWHLAVGVFTSNSSRTAYLDGIAATTNTTTVTPTTPTQTFLGAKVGGLLLWNGPYAFPSFWNVAFSSADVTALYNAGAGANPKAIQGANLKSFPELAAAVSPQPDDITTSWTVTGSPTFVADPFILPSIISPTGIATGAALGSATLKNLNTILPTGIASGAAMGAASLNNLNTILPSGIASGAAAGNPTLSGLNTILPGGIATGMVLGLPIISQSGGTSFIQPLGIPSSVAFGLPTITRVTPGVVTAASCSYADVSAAVASAIDGSGTVIIPAGLCVWNQTLTLSKQITITGQGTYLARAPGFQLPFFTAAAYNQPKLNISGINYVLGTIAMSEHLGRIYARRHLGGPYFGDIPNIYPGPPWAIIPPDAAHTFPNPGPTSWVDPLTPEDGNTD